MDTWQARNVASAWMLNTSAIRRQRSSRHVIFFTPLPISVVIDVTSGLLFKKCFALFSPNEERCQRQSSCHVATPPAVKRIGAWVCGHGTGQDPVAPIGRAREGA